MCDAAGTDILLVGDSAGMVALGYDDTTRVYDGSDVSFLQMQQVAQEKMRS